MTNYRYFSVGLFIIGWLFMASPKLIAQATQASPYIEKEYNKTPKAEIGFKLRQSEVLLNNSPQNSRKIALEALYLASQKKYRQEEAKAHELIGQAYMAQAVHEQALEHFLKGLDILQKIEDWKRVAHILNHIAVLYRRQRRYDETINYSKQALRLAKKFDHYSEIALAHINLGGAYYFKKNYQKSIEYIQSSIDIREKFDEKTGLINSYNNMGLVMRKLKKYQEALRWYAMSLKVNSGESGVKHMRSATLDNIGDVMTDQEKYKEAHEYYNEALKIAHESGVSLRMMEAHQSLYELTTKEQNFKAALYHYRQYVLLKDSFMNTSMGVKMNNLQQKRKIEVSKKEKELLEKDIKLKKSTIYRQKILTASATVGLMLMLILAFVMHRSRRFLQAQKAEIDRQNQALLFTQEEILSQQEVITASNEQLTLQNSKIMSSIRYAQTIQEAILPFSSRLKKVLGEYFVLYKPKDVVSGDFYWLSKLDRYKFIAVVDCTGHGVPGAFMSLIGFSLLNEIINEKHHTDPSVILRQLHEGVFFALKQEQSINRDGMDLCMCRIEEQEEDNLKVVFAGAKRPLYYVSNNQLHTLKGDRVSLGGRPIKTSKQFTNHTLCMKKGDLLYLTTDGYVDTPNPQRQSFKQHRLLQLLDDCKHIPIHQQKHIFENVLNNYQLDAEQRDDITIIGVKL
ncbi:tetratricopeptide repeat protein [uncultured Microscilla sp.]|uniref:tetratricopeptide repeat protein n=1 Tax=uncultured Microscilla sp. TaxID=432653 RepID=UPI00261FCC21|nr:tetratricopeptide repeat protein [uncultured Microscilla sp.]